MSESTRSFLDMIIRIKEGKEMTLPSLGAEIVMNHKFATGLSKETGHSYEELFFRFHKPKMFKGGKFIEPESATKPWIKLSHELVGQHKTAMLMKEKHGRDYEGAWTELGMLSVNHGKVNDILCGRTIDCNRFI